MTFDPTNLDIRCVDGRLMRHLPSFYDPYYEADIRRRSSTLAISTRWFSMCVLPKISWTEDSSKSLSGRPTMPVSEGPKRIQRKRTKGWRMPEGVVYVGRPTVWGNPYIIAPDCQHISWFEADLKRELASRSQPTEDHPWAMHFWRMARRLHELRGKDLACWCGPETACHADVLLKLANDTSAALAGGKE